MPKWSIFLEAGTSTCTVPFTPSSPVNTNSFSTPISCIQRSTKEENCGAVDKIEIVFQTFVFEWKQKRSESYPFLCVSLQWDECPYHGALCAPMRSVWRATKTMANEINNRVRREIEGWDRSFKLFVIRTIRLKLTTVPTMHYGEQIIASDVKYR